MIKKITLIIFLIIGIGFFSACEKEENNTNTGTQEQTTIIAKGPIDWFFGIIVRIQLHRPIPERPRDHKPCGCVNCFGMCMTQPKSSVFNTDFDAYNGMIMFDFENLTATLDILESVSYAEAEFGVDEPVFIPATYLPKEIIEKYSIEKGISIIPNEYTHVSCNNKTVAIDSKVSRKSFGEVAMNFKIE